MLDHHVRTRDVAGVEPKIFFMGVLLREQVVVFGVSSYQYHVVLEFDAAEKLSLILGGFAGRKAVSLDVGTQVAKEVNLFNVSIMLAYLGQF